ncbi:transposase [Petralouisia muris]|nr:transposase [Petralouisia muris]
MVFNLDSTSLHTYSKQEGEAFHYHYQTHSYHPLLCFERLILL